MAGDYDAISFHGVVSGLSAGDHTAEVQYQTQSGTAYLPYVDSSGGSYLRLTSYAVPAAQLVKASSNPTTTASATSTSWAVHHRCSKRWPHMLRGAGSCRPLLRAAAGIDGLRFDSRWRRRYRPRSRSPSPSLRLAIRCCCLPISRACSTRPPTPTPPSASSSIVPTWWPSPIRATPSNVRKGPDARPLPHPDPLRLR